MWVQNRSMEPGMDGRIEEAVEWLERDLKQDFSLTELAQRAGLSPNRFLQVFKREVGESPQQYLIGLRLRRAEHLLAATAMPIRDVVEEVGFRDHPFFTKRFKRTYGVTPTQYRRLKKGEKGQESGET